MLFGLSLSLICQPTSEDIKQHNSSENLLETDRSAHGSSRVRRYHLELTSAVHDCSVCMFAAAADGLATTRGTMPSPVPVLPTDYLHPIPAPEDLFATHSQQLEEAGPAKGVEGAEAHVSEWQS